LETLDEKPRREALGQKGAGAKSVLVRSKNGGDSSQKREDNVRRQ